MKAIILLLAMLITAPATAQSHFGYAGVLCGLDGAGEDFAAEVASFTNIAHVCPTGDIATDAARLARAWELGMTPLFHVEPMFFRRNGFAMWRRNSLDLWQAGLQSIAVSGVPTEELVLYVADEPSLMRLNPRRLEQVIDRIRADLPGARTMVIDAYRDRHPPAVPWNVNYWGFNMYLLSDPAQDERFMRHLNAARNSSPHSVELVLVMDATHTPIHSQAGLAPEDMAEVARNYAALAATEGVAMLLAYAWPGGIEWEDELGARDLPGSVRAAHTEIGRAIVGR
ncbi:hypothetical protein V8J82_10215 [Gymnodinialimonas sp. 2305UL16-5]|uniref:hypothetical protein n=1 Tax=Gymnodinialimonas mytili TaxID=3126503 RepID=UPI0030AE349B